MSTKTLNFFDFFDLDFSDFLSAKFLFILRFTFFSSFLFSNFLSINLKFFYFKYINV